MEYYPNDFDGSDNTYDRIGQRCFGVEIETADCPGYRDYEGESVFGAKYDCSVSGLEFVSSVLSGDKGLNEVADFCDRAERDDYSVDADCGLHVHFDMRNESNDSMKAIGYAMLSTYDVWKDFVDSSRLDNHYCKVHSINLDELFKIANWRDYADYAGRYYWFNFAAYARHRTFEVRLHHGSIDGREICNWIRGISLFMDWASKAGWKGVRNKLLCKDSAGRYDFMCQVWRDAGCDDLVDWFDSMRRVQYA